MDNYLKRPILWDFITGCALTVLSRYYTINKCSLYTVEGLTDFTATLIDNSVSLAGFILAALTIIVTFRANIVSKYAQQEGEKNGLELFLLSPRYDRIIRLFKGTLVSLITCFILLGFMQMFKEALTDIDRFTVIVTCFTVIVLSVIRTLIVLFLLVNMDAKQNTPAH